MQRVNSLALGLLVAFMSLPGISLADEDGEKEGGSQLRQVANANWKAECASCHMLYHPGFLPARSWRKLMGGLDKHFGENASLAPATQQDITNFLVKHSADQSGAKYAKSIPATSTPLRITETAWFKREHDEVRDYLAGIGIEFLIIDVSKFFANKFVWNLQAMRDLETMRFRLSIPSRVFLMR